jgi:hypothetical protein
MDFKSHVDVGLSDVCVLSVLDSANGTQILLKLMALLPVTSSTVIVASRVVDRSVEVNSLVFCFLGNICTYFAV